MGQNTLIIGIDWKESTSAITDDQFKTELTLFAGYVEEEGSKDSRRCQPFHRPMGPTLQEWCVKNIAPRYSAAGVQRFAFLLPRGAPIPPV
jgi:hypothetical protein